MTAREWLDAVEARARWAEPHARDCGCVTCRSQQDVPALVAALRAVLDLADAADTPPPMGPLGASHAVRTRALRAAIDTHLGGAS